MRFGVRWSGATILCALALSASTVLAQAVCTAGDIESRDAGCPIGGETCNITTSHTVTDGCTFDFGERNLVIGSAGRLVVRTGAMTIRARMLTINSGGLIDGRGTAADDVGGTVRIVLSGAATVQGPNGAIDVSADDGGGMILIEAGGPIAINGRLRAIGNIRFGAGGDIVLRSESTVVAAASSQLFAVGAREGGVGGLIDITARGSVTIDSTLDVDGSDGGEVNLYSGQNLALREIEARGTSDAGSGGCVGIQADAALQVLGEVSLSGAGSSQGSGGGCGGFACFEARYGDLTVIDSIVAEGANPDGGGGSIALIADAGSIVLSPSTMISARGNGPQGCGGEICVDASGTINAQTFFDSSGGLAGGDVDLSAHKNINVDGGIDVSGRSGGSCAGTMLIEAGFEAVGAVLINSPINVTASGCGEGGCGIAGLAQISACQLGVTANGGIDAQAGQGGQIELTSRTQLQLLGPLQATKVSNDPQARDGRIDFRHPIGIPPVIGAFVRPLAGVTALPPCTAERGAIDCLMPCPACGNSVVEFPEGCDNGGGANPVSCDGCSLNCQTEDCNDGLNCTIDSCQPARGCRHAPVELPATPCYEPSEATPTNTRTASPTATATGTRTPTLPGNTATPSRTPTTPNTNTPTVTPPTPGGACIGDCDDNERVSVNELVRGVNILLGSQELSECPSFDRNGSDTVTVEELVAAVRIALEDSCDQ